MKMLLTPSQESTLWHFTDTITTPSGQSFHMMPYYLKPIGNGEYDRLTFDQLPEDAKDMILAKKGIKIPTE